MLTGAGTEPRRGVGGLPLPRWFRADTSEALQALELRPTDVVLSSWPKSGTHWVYRAIRLLTCSAVADQQRPMVLAEMLPAERPAEPLPPAPWNPTGLDSFAELLAREPEHARVIVSHALPSMLPPLERGGAGKLVYVCRDPRDVKVSNYFFMGTPKDGWSGSMDRFVAPADVTPNAFGGWPEHVAAFERLARRLGPERACVLEYEAMHSDMRGSLRALAALLGPEAEARLRADGEAIERALGFDAMREAGGAPPSIMRQGVAGGWREHFSEEDETRLSACVAERLPVTKESICGLATWRAPGEAMRRDAAGP